MQNRNTEKEGHNTGLVTPIMIAYEQIVCINLF
jgi:hypothetical protein